MRMVINRNFFFTLLLQTKSIIFNSFRLKSIAIFFFISNNRPFNNTNSILSVSNGDCFPLEQQTTLSRSPSLPVSDYTMMTSILNKSHKLRTYNVFE